VLEIASRGGPCSKLGLRAGIRDLPERPDRQRASGWYCRVVTPRVAAVAESWCRATIRRADGARDVQAARGWFRRSEPRRSRRTRWRALRGMIESATTGRRGDWLGLRGCLRRRSGTCRASSFRGGMVAAGNVAFARARAVTGAKRHWRLRRRPHREGCAAKSRYLRAATCRLLRHPLIRNPLIACG